VEGIIWSRRVSSGGECIILKWRVSSGVVENHLEGVCFIWLGRVSGSGRYSLKQESIFWRRVYHLEGEGIIWRGLYLLVG
jgi:hypothetical protein